MINNNNKPLSNGLHEQEQWLQQEQPVAMFIWAHDCYFMTDIKKIVITSGIGVCSQTAQFSSSLLMLIAFGHIWD